MTEQPSERAAIEEAWIDKNPGPKGFDSDWRQWWGRHYAFQRKLGAEAYLDAVLMLVPVGAYPTLDFVNNRAWLRDANGYDLHRPCHGEGPSISLALLAAIRAQDGRDG